MKKTKIRTKIILIQFLSIYLFGGSANAQNNLFVIKLDTNNTSSINIVHPTLVNKLYQLTANKLLWFLPGEQAHLLRQALRSNIDSSATIGLTPANYHNNEINQNIDKIFPPGDSLQAMQLDRIFSDAAIALC